jgi:peptidyl-prolyl cis-trans isomerase D
MLDALRRGAANWVAKILLGMLVISFAIWGVADVFRGYGRGSLARIGKTEISVDEFQQAYQNELSQISAQVGRRITPEQARMFGLDGRVLSRLVGSAAVDAHAAELGLHISDATVADSVRNEPAFSGPDGKFSKFSFDSYLRQTGMSEGRFLTLRRKDDMRELITDALVSGVAPPQSLIDLLHRYNEETRVIEFLTLDPSKAVKIADPDDAKLKEYFENNKIKFVTPEFRKLAVLLLTRDDVKRGISVTDDEIKSIYEAEKEKFNIPEKRRIQQLAFPDGAAADKTRAELATASNFTEAASKLGFKESDFDLGLITKRDMIDEKIADAAFSLKKDELSQPIEGQFALVLLHVSQIEPGKQRTLEEVSPEIRERLADEHAAQEIQTLHDKVDNERAAAKPLKETAEKLNLQFREIEATNRAGHKPDGSPALDNPDAEKIAQAAFGGSAGVESEAIELSDGGYAWVDVLAVTPEKQKPFEEVKAEVKAAYVESETRKELSALATKLAERVAKGEPMEAIATEVSGKVEKTNPITRNTSPQGLSANAVQQAFALAKGGASSTASPDNTSRTIFRIADVIPAPAATKEQSEKLRADLVRQLQGDVIAEYIGELQARYGVSVNEAAMRGVLGLDRQQ